ncbi:YsnF/AvaK domain-containing protein [Rhizobium grahamii]|uniref:DUF2382 domain-containing protein n=1 Tax=Rhizobium grahamii CCGE 502 TaxID=990285 RepID=S3HCJ5_9HYPH|nr:YsnF/AvaK domain-containing protein [Rhizobium grahamii]EPE96452.1 hypothetical protein RGCCGE502_19920 [Rhizobium grahamii CCGE 502]
MQDEEQKVDVVEERLLVDRERVCDGSVSVTTRTKTTTARAMIDVRRDDVEVQRVPVNRFVEDIPDVTTEGDVTIVPVLEERLVVEKKLFLVEEIWLRRVTTFRTKRVKADLRKQYATVQRISDDDQAKETKMANLYNEDATNYTKGGTSYNTLSAFFDSRFEAESAVSRLKDAGIPEKDIRFMPGYEADTDTADVASDDRSGFWAKLEDFFFPDEDRATYAEGLRRGGFLVSVSSLNDALYETAHDILDDEGSINIDERADFWRSEGWDGQRSSEAFSASSKSASEQDRFDSDLDRVAQSSASREDAFEMKDSTGADLRDETIPVVEENLRVGKRDVNHGTVRVRAYTVEEPIHKQVNLRDETVEIDRRPVDRGLTDDDRAFMDRTISAEEHHEEAIVQKEARVVEEIGIRKTASDRTETIDDTVRKTEVEIEDDRSRGLSQSQDGLVQFQGGQSRNFRKE